MEHVAADLPVVWSDVAISVIVADIVPVSVAASAAASVAVGLWPIFGPLCCSWVTGPTPEAPVAVLARVTADSFVTAVASSAADDSSATAFDVSTSEPMLVCAGALISSAAAPVALAGGAGGVTAAAPSVTLLASSTGAKAAAGASVSALATY